MKLTEVILNEMFHQFNKEFFNDTLTKPKFRLRCLKKALGYCRQEIYSFKTLYTIDISSFHSYNNQMEIAKVLLHEMIHLWQYQNNLMDRENNGHGYYFHFYVNKIKEISNGKYNIDDVAKLKVNVNNNSKSLFHVITFEDTRYNDKTFMLVSTYDKLKTFFERLNNREYILNIKINQSRNQAFGVFTKSNKIAHYYSYENEVFEERFKPLLNEIVYNF